MADEELVIDLADEPQLDLQVEKKPEPVEKKAETDPGIEDLKNQLAQMREREEAALREAATAVNARNQVVEEVKKARVEIVDNQASAIESAIAASQAEINAAKKDLRTALEAGDYDKVAEVQAKLSEVSAELVTLRQGKQDIEARKSEAPKEPVVERQPEPRQLSEAEQFEAAISRASPRAQAWLRAHPEFVKDRDKNLEANAADSMARSKGFIQDSDAYFDFCERFLGLKKDETDPPEQKPRTRTPMPAAPVSRSNVQGNGSHGEQVTLTRGEQLAATDGTHVYNFDDPNGKFKKGDPIGLREMARRKAELTKQGAYDRAYVSQ